jgi:hypothetical protein
VSDFSEVNLSDVPEWARSVFEKDTATVAETTEPVQSALSYKDDAAWPLLMEAAVVNAFLPQDLSPSRKMQGPKLSRLPSILTVLNKL